MEKLLFKLEVFEGPLDLLLNLISKNKINIYDIPISVILSQYMEYMDEMKRADLEITSDFLIMASELIYIKSKMLLPKYEEDEGEDPREQLVKQLLEYKRYKQVSEELFEMSLGWSDTFVKEPDVIELDRQYENSHSLAELREAYIRLFKNASRRVPPPINSFSGIVGRQVATVTSKIVYILRKLVKKGSVKFSNLFEGSKSRTEIVAVFLAVLELAKANRIKVRDEKNNDYNIKIVKNGEK